MGKVCGAGDHDRAGQVQRVDLDVLAGLRSLDDLARAEVHHDVTGMSRVFSWGRLACGVT